MTDMAVLLAGRRQIVADRRRRNTRRYLADSTHRYCMPSVLGTINDSPARAVVIGLIAAAAVAVPIALGTARVWGPTTTTDTSNAAIPLAATVDGPAALLRHLIRTNYHRAATAPAESEMGYQRIADVLVTSNPACWTDQLEQVPPAQVADQIAASLFIRLRTVAVGTPEYDELDGIRRHFHRLRHTATHDHEEMP